MDRNFEYVDYQLFLKEDSIIDDDKITDDIISSKSGYDEFRKLLNSVISSANQYNDTETVLLNFVVNSAIFITHIFDYFSDDDIDRIYKDEVKDEDLIQYIRDINDVIHMVKFRKQFMKTLVDELMKLMKIHTSERLGDHYMGLHYMQYFNNPFITRFLRLIQNRDQELRNKRLYPKNDFEGIDMRPLYNNNNSEFTEQFSDIDKTYIQVYSAIKAYTEEPGSDKLSRVMSTTNGLIDSIYTEVQQGKVPTFIKELIEIIETIKIRSSRIGDDFHREKTTKEKRTNEKWIQLINNYKDVNAKRMKEEEENFLLH